MAEVVAGLVIAIVAELDAKSMKGAVVQAGEKALHYVASLEIEALESGEKFGIELLREGLGGRGHSSIKSEIELEIRNQPE